MSSVGADEGDELHRVSQNAPDARCAVKEDLSADSNHASASASDVNESPVRAASVLTRFRACARTMLDDAS